MNFLFCIRIVVDSSGQIPYFHVCCKPSIFSDTSCSSNTTGFSDSHSPLSGKFMPVTNALVQASIISPRSRSSVLFQNDHPHFSPSDIVVVQEPFWVQESTGNSPWMAADDASKQLIDSKVTLLDKRKFWEMLKLVQDIESLNLFCRNRLKTASLIADTLGRVEYCSLWSSEAPECLTQEALFALLTKKFNN